MINNKYIKCFLLFLISFSFFLPLTPLISIQNSEPEEEFIIVGNILTMNKTFPRTEALYIKNNKILDSGLKMDLIKKYSSKNEILVRDFGQLTILPGFIDGHSHNFNKNSNFEVDQDLALSYGFTTVNEKYVNQNLIESLFDFNETGKLKIRLNLFPAYNDAILDENRSMILLKTWFPEHAPIKDLNNKIRIPGIKIFVDGSFAPSRGLWAVSNPYTQSQKEFLLNYYPEEYWKDNGDLYWDPAILNQTVKLAQDSGFSVAFHAMGDLAIETALKAISFALMGEDNIAMGYRHQIEHNSFIRPDLIQIYKEIDPLTAIRGYYNTCEEDENRLFFDNTAEWNTRRYNLPSIVSYPYLETDFAWTYSIGSDNSSSRHINPFLHLYGMVTRKQIHPSQSICEPDDWVKKYEINISRALEIMTIGGAYAASQETVIGSLDAGKFADLIVISHSPLDISPDQLKDLEVLVTMIGGEIVYTKDKFAWKEIIFTSSAISYSIGPGIFIVFVVVGIIRKNSTKK